MPGASKGRQRFVLLNNLIKLNKWGERKGAEIVCDVKNFLKGISGKGKMPPGELMEQMKYHFWKQRLLDEY